MRPSHRLLHPFRYCFWTGLGLMSFALFLQPMDPINFLVLVFSDPLETVRESYGIQAAILFWVSAGLVFVGIAGIVCRAKVFRSLPALKTRPTQTAA